MGGAQNQGLLPLSHHLELDASGAILLRRDPMAHHDRGRRAPVVVGHHLGRLGGDDLASTPKTVLTAASSPRRMELTVCCTEASRALGPGDGPTLTSVR